MAVGTDVVIGDGTRSLDALDATFAGLGITALSARKESGRWRVELVTDRGVHKGGSESLRMALIGALLSADQRTEAH